MSSQKSKFQKRINELREEIEREKSLRHSLEESHNTLLARIREMESIVESESKEVRFTDYGYFILKDLVNMVIKERSI